VLLDLFRQFLAAIEDEAVHTTKWDVSSLARLCDGFGFLSLSLNLSAFRESPSRKDSAGAE
jgi:hypothetical protein